MLRELCQLAARENLIGDSTLEVRPVAWMIELKANGDFLNFSGTHRQEPPGEPKKSGKPGRPREFAKKFTIPRQFNPKTGGTRTAGDYAYFLVDKSDYVLGCALGAKKGTPPTDGKLLNRLQLFTDTVRDCYESTREVRLQAVLAFLTKVAAEGLPEDLPDKTAPGDLFAFVVRPDIDEFVHDNPSVMDFWRKACEGNPATESGGWECLITGNPIGEPPLFPMIKRVPGGQAQTGLVSFNKPAFESHGWEGNANAPTSPQAAQAASVALNRLLDPAYQTQEGKVLPKRHIQISKDTIACFWARDTPGDETADALPAALQADPGGKPGEFWRAAWCGRPPANLDPTRFYAVTLTGAQGRAIVRDWHETTVGAVQASVAEYFRQMEMVPNTFPGKGRELPPAFGLKTIQESLTATQKADDLPSKFAAELFAACINQKRRFPSALLGLALDRMRAEAGRDQWIDSHRRDARTGLIKAILMRNHHYNLTPTMDAQNTQPGYLLGRLFACIERMQYLALGEVNASVANRYFASASTQPLLVFGPLVRDLTGHYFKKAARKKPAAAWMVQRHVCEIQTLYGQAMDQTAGYPARLSPVQQGLFMIGYHTQVGHYLPKRDKSTDDSPSSDPSDAPPAVA